VPLSDHIFLIVISLNLLLASWLALRAVYRGQDGASSLPPIIATAAVLGLVFLIGGMILNSSANSIEPDHLAAEIRSIADATKSMQKDIAALKDDIAKTNEKISNVQGGIAELKGKIVELRDIADATQSMQKDVASKGDIAKAEEKISGGITELKEKIAELQNHNAVIPLGSLPGPSHQHQIIIVPGSNPSPGGVYLTLRCGNAAPSISPGNVIFCQTSPAPVNVNVEKCVPREGRKSYGRGATCPGHRNGHEARAPKRKHAALRH